MQTVFTIQELFTDKVFRVPDYQRGYAWEPRQLDEFWEDLEYLSPDREHYAGTVIIHGRDGQVLDEEGKAHKAFDIVDGQQRLTTIVVLLNCLFAEFNKSNPTLAEGIRKSYIRFKNINGQPEFKLRLNSDSQNYWANSVLAEPIGPQGPSIASHERLRFAKDHFLKRVSSERERRGLDVEAWLMELFTKLTQQVKLNQYVVSDSADVGVIFEVMNDRGKPLSDLEKVKNYLLYLSSKLELSENPLTAAINATWAEIFQRLMAAGLVRSEDEDRLLRSHWIMAYEADATKWDGSKSIKTQFRLKDFTGSHDKLLDSLLRYVKTLRDSLVPFCDAYRPLATDSFLVYAEDDRGRIRKYQEKLRRVRVIAPFLPLLIACRLRFPDDAEKYLALLQLGEIFAFRVYRVASRRSNAGQPKLFRLGHRLFKGEVSFDEVMLKIRHYALRYCSDNDFRTFASLDDRENKWYGWSGLKYFLYEYEESLARGREIKLSWDTVEKGDPQKTIEHTLPQEASGKYWKERFNAEARKKYTDDIGNLCLTEDNSAYGNKSFPDKKGFPGEGRCYANGNFFMERELAAFSDWDETSLTKRRNKILDWYRQRWHLDEPQMPSEHEEPDEDIEEES